MLKALRQLLDGVVAFFQVRSPSKSEERRRLIRLRCDYQVQCVVDQTSFTARIADMGLNGMRIRLSTKLKPGSKIFVYHPSRAQDKVEEEYVLCEVRWCRRRRDSEELEAGLKYADITGNMRRSWVKFLLKELGFDERAIYTRRKLIRADSSMVGLLLCDDGQAVQGTVVNLGAGGALFESLQSFHPTARVRLSLGPLGKLRPLEVSGIILHIRPTDQGQLHTSIRFEDLKASQVKLLGQYVVQLLRMISV
jgi:hypothetical protein